MSILRTKVFAQQQQYLDESQHKSLKRAVRKIADNPDVGKPANASLSDIWVYRVGMLNKPWLLGLAYRQSATGLTLLALNVSNKIRNIA